MNIRRSYKVQDLQWGALPELTARLTRQRIEVEDVEAELSRYPDKIRYDTLDEAANAALTMAPRGYSIHIRGKRKGGQYRLHITRDKNIHGEPYLYVDAGPLGNAAELDEITGFLGLVPDEGTATKERTAFIAHRFDDLGAECADKLARFLELLGFSVTTGRAYAPGSVSEKVKSRLSAQAIVFAVLTPGENDTWLIQESVFAEARDKPLFVIKDRAAKFMPGILADLEYIPFAAPLIESTFIPILEGLRELEYMTGT